MSRSSHCFTVSQVVALISYIFHFVHFVTTTEKADARFTIQCCYSIEKKLLFSK